MSKLLEEPTSLPAHHIYQGGSAPGVQCANCSAGATSGSWRRGWELEDKSNANLCNRCGQRWVKLGKALAKNGFAQAAAIVDPRPRQAGPPPRLPLPPSSSGGAATTTPIHAGTKRPFSLFNSSNLASQGPAHRRASTATMRSRLRSETTSETSEGGGGLSTNDDSPPPSSELPFHSPETVAALGCTPPKYLSPTNNNNLSPSQFPSQNYVPRYCLQKMSEGRTTYALFWVLGSRAAGGTGSPILAVVGIDSRSSGHFSYTSIPGAFPPSTTPLRCTSRTDVISWLIATMGVDPREKPVPESHARLPPLTVPELLNLLGEDLHHSKLTSSGLGTGGYTPILPGQQLPLVESPFVSPVIIARSSPTKLGRGAKIKPGFNVIGVIDAGAGLGLVINKNNNTPAAPETLLVNDVTQNGGSCVLPRFRCGACGRDDHATDDCFLTCTSPPTLIHNPGVSDVHASLDALLLAPAGAGAGAGGGNADNNIINDINLDLLFGNGEDDSPMQATAFDSFLDISFGPGGALISPEPSPGAVTQPVPRTAAGAHSHTISANPTANTTAGGGGAVATTSASLMPPPPAIQLPPKQQQQHQQQQGSNKDGLEDTIRDWAVTLLSGNISESLPFSQGGGFGGRWVPLGEALAILHHLSMLDLSMEILEKTQISRAVGMLRNHNNLSIASAAHALAARWQQYAVAALQNANYVHSKNNTARIQT